VTVVAALAAWSARETHRVVLADLGNPQAVPLDAAALRQLRAPGTR
jgi:hypothetical protein